MVWAYAFKLLAIVKFNIKFSVIIIQTHIMVICWCFKFREKFGLVHSVVSCVTNLHLWVFPISESKFRLRLLPGFGAILSGCWVYYVWMGPSLTRVIKISVRLQDWFQDWCKLNNLANNQYDKLTLFLCWNSAEHIKITHLITYKIIKWLIKSLL